MTETTTRTTTITTTENGPYQVVGDIAMFDFDGRAVANVPAGEVHLCRCGESANKPFCDGTHAAVGFDGTLSN